MTYLLETWGDAGLQGLIAAFRQGTSPRAAVQEALAITWEEFEAGWITWMGVPATPAAPPTPTATLVRPTAPSGWPTPTRRAMATPSVTKMTATSEPSPALEATLSPTATANAQPSRMPAGAPAGRRRPARMPCGGAALGPIVCVGMAWLVWRRDLGSRP